MVSIYGSLQWSNGLGMADRYGTSGAPVSSKSVFVDITMTIICLPVGNPLAEARPSTMQLGIEDTTLIMMRFQPSSSLRIVPSPGIGNVRSVT